MSKRRILNLTSEKKRDKMLTWTNTTSAASSGGTTYQSTPAILVGGSATPYVFPWCSTLRDNTLSSGGAGGNKFDLACRTASTCYMVGLKESIEIQCADGLPWQWRRICFAFKGGPTLAGFLPPASTSFSPGIEISVGQTRTINSLTSAQQATFFSLLFQGAVAQDWQDPLTAKVDSERVSLKYDKTMTIASGNEDGVIRRYNRWHKMGHNLVYDDDERGADMTAATTSVSGRQGMGDFWVVDIIKPRVGSTNSNQLLFNAESTLYWHER